MEGSYVEENNLASPKYALFSLCFRSSEQFLPTWRPMCLIEEICTLKDLQRRPVLIFLVFYDCGCQLVLCKIVGPWVASHSQQIGNQTSLQIKSTRYGHKGNCCTLPNCKTCCEHLLFSCVGKKGNQFIGIVKTYDSLCDFFSRRF